MTSRILLISLSLSLLLVGQKVGAQYLPAENFFDSGAQFYISNNIPAALTQVENGLKIYPDDDKLKRLEQLLKQQQQQQQQQQQDQQKQDQQKQDQPKQQQQQQNQQQNQQQKSGDQQKQDQQKDEEKKSAEQKQEDEKKAQEQAAQKKADENKDKADQTNEDQVVKAGEMSPEEAKRLLDAQKGDEQLLQMKPQEKRNSNRPVKDW